MCITDTRHDIPVASCDRHVRKKTEVAIGVDFIGATRNVWHSFRIIDDIRSRVRSCNSSREKDRDKQRERERGKGKEKQRGRDICRSTTKRKGERDRGVEGKGRSCPLCLGTGHLHRETFHGKFFTRRRGFSPETRRATFLRGDKRRYLVFKRVTLSETGLFFPPPVQYPKDSEDYNYRST